MFWFLRLLKILLSLCVSKSYGGRIRSLQGAHLDDIDIRKTIPRKGPIRYPLIQDGIIN